MGNQRAGSGTITGLLGDVADIILDKGLVIDPFVRTSLVSLELRAVDARDVVAGVDTYLHFAEAANRLDLGPRVIGGGVQKIRERSE